MSSLTSQPRLEQGSVTSIYSTPTLSLGSLISLFFLVTAFRHWESFEWQRGLLQFLWDAFRFVAVVLAFACGLYLSYGAARDLDEDGFPMDVVHIVLYNFRTLVLLLLGLINHLALNSTTRRRSVRRHKRQQQRQQQQQGSLSPRALRANSPGSRPTERTALLAKHRAPLDPAAVELSHSTNSDERDHAALAIEAGEAPWRGASSGDKVTSTNATLEGLGRRPAAQLPFGALTHAGGVVSAAAMGPSAGQDGRLVRGWIPPWAGAQLSSWLVLFLLGTAMEFSYFVFYESDVKHGRQHVYLGSYWFVDVFLLYVFGMGAWAWDDWGMMACIRQYVPWLATLSCSPCPCGMGTSSAVDMYDEEAGTSGSVDSSSGGSHDGGGPDGSGSDVGSGWRVRGGDGGGAGDLSRKGSKRGGRWVNRAAKNQERGEEGGGRKDEGEEVTWGELYTRHASSGVGVSHQASVHVNNGGRGAQS